MERQELSKSHRHVFESLPQIADFVADCVLECASKSVAERGIFTLGVSGGSIINILSEKLASQKVDWTKWKVFFCDERLTPFSDPESTYGQYKKKLIDVVGCEKSWIPINPDLNVEECATDYQNKVEAIFGTVDTPPSFDMLLLGMGPDGHTCSLFPGHQLLKEKDRLIAPISDSPKPPPCRVTMTLPVLNNSRNAVFISAGASKADTLKEIFNPTGDPLPATLVKPKNGTLRWVMDKAAASKIDC